MKKKIILTCSLFLTMVAPVFATALPTKAPNKFEAFIVKFNIDREVSKVINAKFASDIPTANDSIDKMREYGAKNIRVRFYKPCACSGQAIINGKIVEAKDKHCSIVSYEYNGEKYEAGKCKKIDTDKK